MAIDPCLRPSAAVAEPGVLAEALARHARESGYAKPLYVLPDEGRAGRAEPGRVRTWWIGPERRGPLCRHGKIIVTSRYDGAPAKCRAASLFVGLCVQKGLEPAESAPGARWEPWVMAAHPRWIWADFLPEMAAGYIDPLAAKAEDVGGCPLTVILEARDPRGGDGGETIGFEWSRGELIPWSLPHRRARGQLRDLASASTLATLAQRLRSAPRCRGLWVELAIGFRLWARRTGPGAAAWGEGRIWESACRPWSLWLR